MIEQERKESINTPFSGCIDTLLYTHIQEKLSMRIAREK